MISLSNSIHTVFFLLSIFFLNLIQSNTIFCPEIEKQSLLSLKQSFNDPNNLLSSWDGEVDCCNWRGVVCCNSTGHVRELHLQESGLSGKLNPSLLNLKHLTYFDLSNNNFDGETIPSFIGSFTNMEYLDLSNSMFKGKIPNNIGNLSNLHALNLESDWLMNHMLNADSLEWLSRLSKLEYLNMNRVNLSRATNWAKVINSIPSLQELYFSDCNLDFKSPLDVVNHTSLTHVDFSGNNASYIPVPPWFFQLKNLLFVNLYKMDFIGPLPTVSNATKLQYIRLDGNNFNSSIPDWLYFCKDLEFVSFSSNSLQHKILDAIANLTSLESFDLSYNSLSGALPISLGNISSLEYLFLHDNNFVGNIPEGLGLLSKLEELFIANNKLEGVVTESHFANLSKLTTFSASGNQLRLNVGPKWAPPKQLKTLLLASWRLGVGSELPSWLETQGNIMNLDISNTGISGIIPHWFFNVAFLNASHNNFHGTIPPVITHKTELSSRSLILSSNKLSGSLPRIDTYSVDTFDVSKNLFSKGLFEFLCYSKNQANFLLLNLEGNMLTGELHDCWKWPSLRILKLGNNTLSGTIPNSIGFLHNLVYLSLSNKKFSGKIPSSIQNCTHLLKMDMSNNNLDGNLPTLIGTSLVHLKFLILHSNKLTGKIFPMICHLQSLQILDLSHNQFSGIIPSCVFNFTAMATKRWLALEDYGILNFPFDSVSIVMKGVEMEYSTTLSLVTVIDLSSNNLSGQIPNELTSLVELRSLNLSGNHLTGPIPNRIGDMKQLESLDFSRNSLSGQIPNSFALVSSLNYLNLSFNKLTGRIPEGTQLQTLEASSFIGNDLCGPPLNNCSHGGGEVRPCKQEEEGVESEIKWFYVILSLGFAVGFSATCSALVLKKAWRDSYFGLLECVWDNIYVYFYIKLARLTRSATSILGS